MLYRIQVKDDILPYFLGQGKDLEVRLNRGTFQKIAIDDEFLINARVRRRVVDIRRYDDVSAMLEREDVKRILPRASKEELLRRMNQFYSPAEMQEHGIIVFELAAK